MIRLLSFAFLLLLSLELFSQQPIDKSVMLNVVSDSMAETITISWPTISGATQIRIYRKDVNASNWTLLEDLTPSDTSFTDTTVSNGIPYEYHIFVSGSPVRNQYLLAGINLPPQHKRGAMLLLIDSTYIGSLADEIETLVNDLTGDGWYVKKAYAGRTEDINSVKNKITDFFNDFPNENLAVYLLGHIPLPYSGNLNPDGHNDHKGAWPADMWYGDLTGSYTDVSVNNSSAPRQKNQNIPGDGKFDQSILAGQVELQIGRVDLYNMPAFSTNDTFLIRRYLNKSHLYKHKVIAPKYQSVIDDNFGYMGGESFASSAWKNFASILDSDSLAAGDYFTSQAGDSYIWSYGCGAGSYVSCSGVGNTNGFVADSLQGIFTMLFGSYFGDWDTQNNFLRAPLALPGWTLTNVWSGRPYWVFHHMAMGWPVGYSAKITQNNNSTYEASYGARMVHIALMGDPSLRMYMIEPVSNLTCTPNVAYDAVDISWVAPAEPIEGYYIYRSAENSDSMVYVGKTGYSSSSFLDYPPYTGMHKYMVRAYRLEQVKTGSFYNMSIGLIDSAQTTSINEIAEENSDFSLMVWPNPALDLLNIKCNSTVIGPIEIFLYDISGRMIQHRMLHNSTMTFDLSYCQPGVYLLRFVGDDNFFITKKIVKL